MQIHLGDIQLKLCEGNFHEDNEKSIQYIPIVKAEVTIWNRDKTKVLYHNTANDDGVLELSNSEINDDEFALYLEINHQDFEKTPIGGNIYARKGMEKQENRIYFKRIQLRLKHAPFAKLQTPKEFHKALNPANKERKQYAQADKEDDDNWENLKKKADEMLRRNEAILQKYELEAKNEKDEVKKKAKEDQLTSKRKRHEKQKKDLEEIKEGKCVKDLKHFINTRVGADYAEWVTALTLARHAPHLCHQRIDVNGDIQDNYHGKGSDPDFLINLDNGKRMIIEVKNYGYSSSLELTDQIAYQLKCVREYEMNYAIACNQSTRIGNRTIKGASQQTINYDFVIDPKNNSTKNDNNDFNAMLSKNSKNNKDLQVLKKTFNKRGQGLRKILIKMYQDALNGNSNWVFVKRLNFRSNLESLDKEQSSEKQPAFDLETHCLNLYSNLHSEDRKAFQCEFEAILEP